MFIVVFTKVNQIVQHHGGSIHEYKGDSVLVVWDGDGASPALSALNASIEIEREINSTLLSETGVEGLEPLAVGIGIEQGPVLRGSIGPASRRAHTLCGETVSVVLRSRASRGCAPSETRFPRRYRQPWRRRSPCCSLRGRRDP